MHQELGGKERSTQIPPNAEEAIVDMVPQALRPALDRLGCHQEL